MPSVARRYYSSVAAGAIALAIVVGLIAQGCDAKRSSSGRPSDLLTIESTSSQSASTDLLNRQLAEAHAAGQPWASNPIQIVSKLINPELARDAVWAMSGSGERPSRYRVVVVVDGFADDSVRGKRYEATLERASSGSWQLRDVSVGWRCWRGRTSVFGIEPCT
jgi:hypothetical protein